MITNSLVEVIALVLKKREGHRHRHGGQMSFEKMNGDLDVVPGHEMGTTWAQNGHERIVHKNVYRKSLKLWCARQNSNL